MISFAEKNEATAAVHAARCARWLRQPCRSLARRELVRRGGLARDLARSKVVSRPVWLPRFKPCTQDVDMLRAFVELMSFLDAVAGASTTASVRLTQLEFLEPQRPWI